ncbi:MAG: ammonium transporter [Chloroflexi bacterium AL-W]|nr:ammonium transporter [Chloroflexi bacterium AL-N1]NOK66913.1 ammonium transporter [Chloroflexi bacterium AL-N10]NOK74795.1 ammonium transporter [Chloroflexi bacterium AL-N5]NOK81515.1 ammonium transporter [Chloroflexi bacterium AL-W]NOK88985.1 ammonium transporter [Chloroflexi bacterium AL-N15]
MLKRRHKLMLVLGAVIGLLMVTSGGAFAQDDGPDVAELATAMNTLWLLLAAFLVFFMQAGFAMVESGFTRSKSTVNILMKNLMDFSVAALVFWAIGWGIAYGNSIGGLFGGSDFFVGFDPAETGEPKLASWLFQVVFAGTAATIVSGAMAERTKFTSYLIYTFFISLFIYPVVVHWVWSGAGWLNDYDATTVGDWGFTDFAGSTVVHSVGGWAALMGAIFLGPRLGRFGPNGEPRAIPGHNMALGALGVFILWFGWYGFNPGSQLALSSQSDANAVALVATTTTLAAAAGAVGAMFTTWFRSGKPEMSMTFNGALGGLVAITAPCAYVSPLAAVIIGLVAGPLIVFSSGWLESFKIDDPVGAVPVHLVNGVWGTLAVGLFASVEGNTGTLGLFYGGGATLLIAQVVGVIAIGAWTAATAALMFFLIKLAIGLRISPEQEAVGLDVHTHGTSAYPDIIPMPETTDVPKPVVGGAKVPAN